MTTISVKLQGVYINFIDQFVDEGRFKNRSEAIRVAISDLLEKELLSEESINILLNSIPIEEKIES